MERVGGRPAADLRIVVSGAEADQACVAIVEAAGKAEGLEAGVGVQLDLAEAVVVQALGHGAGDYLHHKVDRTDGSSGGDRTAVFPLWFC